MGHKLYCMTIYLNFKRTSRGRGGDGGGSESVEGVDKGVASELVFSKRVSIAAHGRACP